MKITVKQKPDAPDIEVLISCASVDSTVCRVVSVLSAIDAKLTCRKNGTIFQIDAGRILYIESVERKTFLYTEDQIYETDKRLYELEQALKNCSFFRASKSVIINLQRVQSLRPELGARLLLTMDNQEQIIVSRQYAGTIKSALEVD